MGEFEFVEEVETGLGEPGWVDEGAGDQGTFVGVEEVLFVSSTGRGWYGVVGVDSLFLFARLIPVVSSMCV